MTGTWKAPGWPSLSPPRAGLVFSTRVTMRRRSRASFGRPINGRLKATPYVLFFRASRIACTSDSGTSSGTESLAHSFARRTVFS